MAWLPFFSAAVLDYWLTVDPAADEQGTRAGSPLGGLRCAV